MSGRDSFCSCLCSCLCPTVVDGVFLKSLVGSLFVFLGFKVGSGFGKRDVA